jgi:hypothetical protein
LYAAIFAGVVTAGYIHAKNKINNEKPLVTSDYMKPAVLVAILVYFIINVGMGAKETISTDPF